MDAKEFRQYKIKKIETMIKENIEFQEYINENKNKLSKNNILEFFETKTNGLDTFLHLYLDVIKFMSAEEFHQFMKFRNKDFDFENTL